MTNEHTPEPWQIDLGGYFGTYVIDSNGSTILWLMEEPQVANARRIVACVNALAVVPTEDLEHRPELYRAAPQLLEACQKAEQWIGNVITAFGVEDLDSEHPLVLLRAALSAAQPDTSDEAEGE